MSIYTRILALSCLALLSLCGRASAQGTIVVASCGDSLAYIVGQANRNVAIDINGIQCTAASVSASITGFPGTQTTGTPISVTTGGVTGTLPSGTEVVATNVGTTNAAYCKLGASATTSDQYISPNGGWFAFTVGAATQLTCITSTSTTTVNMVGGSGLPTGTGGGGGGSGSGSSSITSWGGGVLGAMANYGTSPGAVLVPGVNAFVTNVNTNGQATMVNSSPVVIASNQSAVPVSLAAVATGGSSTTGNIAANNTTAVVVKASAGTLYGVQVYGIGSAPAYLKIYNATSATCGSGTPVKRLMIPSAATAANGAGSNITFGTSGVAFGTGITYCITTGIADNDTTAPAAATFLVNVDWL